MRGREHGQESKSIQVTSEGTTLIWQDFFSSIDYGYPFFFEGQGLILSFKKYTRTHLWIMENRGFIQVIKNERIQMVKAK